MRLFQRYRSKADLGIQPKSGHLLPLAKAVDELKFSCPVLLARWADLGIDQNGAVENFSSHVDTQAGLALQAWGTDFAHPSARLRVPSGMLPKQWRVTTNRRYPWERFSLAGPLIIWPYNDITRIHLEIGLNASNLS